MNGKRVLAVILSVIGWAVLLAYLIFVSRYCSSQQERQMCSGLRVQVLDSASMGFITSQMVKNWFATENMQLEKQELSKINTLELEKFIARRGFVKWVRVYTSMDGMLNIELTQRRPIARVNTSDGYNFYITDDNYILPQQRYHVVYVPVITGTFDPPFAKDFIGSFDELGENEEKKSAESYKFFSKLINFVKFVRTDEFRNSFVVQINVVGDAKNASQEPEIEIVPRAGNHIVLLGTIENCEEKFSRLMAFYRNGLAYDGWDKYRYVNLKYRGQIVCTE